VRQENPLGHSNFLIGLKSSGERNGGLGLARYKSVLSRLSVGRPYAICHWYATPIYGRWQVGSLWPWNCVKPIRGLLCCVMCGGSWSPLECKFKFRTAHSPAQPQPQPQPQHAATRITHHTHTRRTLRPTVWRTAGAGAGAGSREANLALQSPVPQLPLRPT
jgi:hypothetical protein